MLEDCEGWALLELRILGLALIIALQVLVADCFVLFVHVVEIVRGMLVGCFALTLSDLVTGSLPK